MNRHTFLITDNHPLTIQPNEIHLWIYSLDKHNVSALSLNQQERDKAHRFYFEKHKRRYTVAHVGLRHILGRYLNEPADAILFSHHTHGKPYLTSNHPLTFNLSHSGEWAMLGVGLHHELGVDIEQYSHRPYLDLAKNHFSEVEYQWLDKAPSAFKTALFFQIWAQKEAFIKRSGLGLSRATDDFITSPQSGKPVSLTDTVDNFNAIIHPFMAMPSFAGAVCMHQDVNRISLFMERT